MSRKKRRKPRRPRPAGGNRTPAHQPRTGVAVQPRPGTSPGSNSSPGRGRVPGSGSDRRGSGEPRGGELEILVGLVTTGALDEHLGVLQAAISERHRDRRREAARQAAARFQVGDRVMIDRAIRPLYLQGATGTVTGWSGHSAVVQLDVPAGRFATGELRCPPLGLHRITG